MKATNFDKYLKEHLKDKRFAERFLQAGEAWEVSLRISALRKQAGLSQQELARRLGTTQQQISRLESPAYEGHTLSMLRRLAAELNAEVHVTFKTHKNLPQDGIAESRPTYRKRRND